MEDNRNKIELMRPAITITIIAVIMMLIASAISWQKLPNDVRVPVHWNIAGKADRYGSKFQGLMLMPLFTIFLAVCMVVVPLVDPHYRHIKSSMKAYNIILSAIALLMTFLHFLILMATFGQPIDIMKNVCLAIGLLFILIGNYTPKIRSNYFLGIRTPWTLSSELSWHKTHCFAGRLFILLGALIGLGGLTLPGIAVFVILLVGVIGLLLSVTIYSYVIWQKDPEKRKV